MAGFSVWLLVLMGAAFYLLGGIACYLVLESRQSLNPGPREPDPFFTPWEMTVIILSWPTLVGYMIYTFIRRWRG